MTGLAWNTNNTLWLCGAGRDDTGNDHGLAIDNFALTAGAAASVRDGGTTAGLFGVTLDGLVVLRRQSG